MKHFANIKNAGTPKEKVFISFYQFKGNLIKENIPTSSICSEDYFYDREGKIEDALSNMETRWGKAINHAINGSFTEEDIEYLTEHLHTAAPFILDKTQILVGTNGQYTPAIGAALHYVEKFIQSV